MPLGQELQRGRRADPSAARRAPGVELVYASWLRRAGLLLFPLVLCGCQSVMTPFSQWRAAYDGYLVKGPTGEEMADVTGPTDSPNLLDRWLTPRNTGGLGTTGDKSSTLILGSEGWRPMIKPAKDPKADAEYQAAMNLFQQGKLADAQKAFAKIAKDRKGTPWGENSQFYLAETCFLRKNYVSAHDNYEQLIKDYAWTDYREKLTAREYEIARLWLLQGDPQAPKDKLIDFFGHFDGRLPLVDTQGSALQALEHVQHNDPAGPLADDAALAVANYHVKHKDYESASIYYEQFMHDHSKSPYLHDVYHAAIDTRLKGYLGPDYDGSGLEKARDLVRKTLKLFPDEEQAKTEGLFHTLDLINDAEAEKTFKQGMYYKRVRKVASAEYYFGKIPQRWPNSPWAVKAKAELAALAKLPRTQSKPTKIIIPPGATDPFGGGMMGGMGMGMGGMGMGGMGMPMGMGGMM
jgi:outer membrane protein assembly factor BamD (BamD/ComL family)